MGTVGLMKTDERRRNKVCGGEQTIKSSLSLFTQPADRLEVHPRGGGANQSLPGRLQRGGASGVASLL